MLATNSFPLRPRSLLTGSTFITGTVLMSAPVVCKAQTTLAAPQQTVETTQNPYWPMANRSLDTILGLSENDLLNKEPATNAFWLAWGYASPHSRKRGDADVLDKCVRLWNVLAERYWAPEKKANLPGVGSWNHLPLLESLRFMEPVQKIEASNKAGWKAALRPHIERDFLGYGQATPENWATTAAGDYPNADAQHLAIMYAGYLIYGDEKYKTNAQQFVASMAKHLRPPGAWLYYRHSTPIPLYHGFEIIFLGRYYQLSRDAAAADQIRRTKDFYPCTYAPEDTVEYSSSPWWKQMWNPLGGPYHAPELVALITRDPQNRWFANLRAKRYFQHYWIAYCGEAWDEAKAGDIKAQPFPDNYIIADASLDGFRGRFGAFSWMGGRGKNIMSFGGALLADRALPSGYDGYLQMAHIGIGIPEAEGKPYYDSLRLIADPEQTPTTGAHVLGEDYAALAVSYIPRLQTKEKVGYDDWKVTELWLFTAKGIVASLQATALKDNPGTLPQGLVRLGPLGRPHALQGNRFHAGNLHGQVLASDFAKTTMVDGSPDQHGKDQRVEVRLNLDGQLQAIQAGQKFGYTAVFSPNANLPVSMAHIAEKSLTVQLDGTTYRLQYDGERQLTVAAN